MIKPQDVINHAEGDRYEGEYENGTYHGQGRPGHSDSG